MQPLLPRDALAGKSVALSASETADLSRLGFVQAHFHLAVAEIARCVLVAGGTLAYGGHLRPGGLTSFLIHELERYGRKDQSFVICLCWHVHRAMSLADLEQSQHALGLFGQLVFLDLDGEVLETGNIDRASQPEVITDDATKEKGLTSLRRFMAKRTAARVVIGGKRAGFEGAMPGLIEEALTTLEAGGALYVVGGFGGVAVDIARALNIDDGSWLPGLSDAVVDPRLSTGLEALRAFAAKPEWRGPDNGLTAEENRQLAVSYRPSEIAALISLGLGRKFEDGAPISIQVKA